MACGDAGSSAEIFNTLLVQEPMKNAVNLDLFSGCRP